MPSPANSLIRSASPTALTSASSSFAPARPRPRATACPICPTRPTPVTSATLPWKSAGTTPTVSRRDDGVHGRRAALGETHRAVPPDHVDRALKALAVGFQGVVGARDRALRVRQQREVEAH